MVKNHKTSNSDANFLIRQVYLKHVSNKLHLTSVGNDNIFHMTIITLISNSWKMKARLHVIITFTIFLMNINQTLFVARVMHAATGVMISIDGLSIVWYTLIELCALGKFVHRLGIWPKLKKEKKWNYDWLNLHQNHTQQNCTLFSYLNCKLWAKSVSDFSSTVIHDQKCKTKI